MPPDPPCAKVREAEGRPATVDYSVPSWNEWFQALSWSAALPPSHTQCARARAPSQDANVLCSIMRTVTEGPVVSFAHKRLSILEGRFDLHQLLNSVRDEPAHTKKQTPSCTYMYAVNSSMRCCGMQDFEASQQKSVPHRDFYNIRKVLRSLDFFSRARQLPFLPIYTTVHSTGG